MNTKQGGAMYFSDSTRPSDVMIKTITPNEAKKMLGSNFSGQRNMKKSTLQKFEKDIKAGRWNPYRGDLVRVSDKGTVIDGQHRLRACIKTNEPISVLYLEGFSEEEFVYLDSGAARSNADSLGGIKNATKISAMIKFILAYEKFGLDASALRRYRASNAEIAARYEPNFSDFAAETAALTRFNFGSNRAAFAFFFWLSDQVDRPMTIRFREDLSSELVIDQSIAKFRNTLGKRLQKRVSIDGADMVALLVDTWNGYVTRKPMKQLAEPKKTGQLYMFGLNAYASNYVSPLQEKEEADG